MNIKKIHSILYFRYWITTKKRKKKRLASTHSSDYSVFCKVSDLRIAQHSVQMIVWQRNSESFPKTKIWNYNNIQNYIQGR